MPNFTDTPVANRFFDHLSQFERIFRDELGPHFEVSRATLASTRLGEYPGIRVQGRRHPNAALPCDLDVFFHWAPEKLEAFVNSDSHEQHRTLLRLSAGLGAAIRAAGNPGVVDLESASQSHPETLWLRLINLDR